MSATIVPPKLILGPELAGALVTPEEFDEVKEYDEEYRYELVHGVLIVVPIPLAEETDPKRASLGHWLRTYCEQYPEGAALDATLPQQYIRTRSQPHSAGSRDLGRPGTFVEPAPGHADDCRRARLRQQPQPRAQLHRQAREYLEAAVEACLDHRPLPRGLTSHAQRLGRAARGGGSRGRRLPLAACCRDLNWY